MAVFNNDSILVVIGGGHAAGKSTVAHSLKNDLAKAFNDIALDIQVLNMEDYLIEPKTNKAYDSQKSFAISVAAPGDLNLNLSILKPSRYDFDKLKTYVKSQLDSCKDSLSQKVIIVHGLYALYDKELRDMSKLKVFISGDADSRLIRWIRRDVVNGEETLESIINQYLQESRAEMNDFIFPTKAFSDVIMPYGPESNAINLLVDGIIPYIANPDIEFQAVQSNLRPSANDLLQSERYEEQKRSYYELS